MEQATMTRIETVPAGETTEKYLQRTERGEMVTTCNGHRYSQAELRAAFSLVEDTDNWKNPIDAWIDASLWPIVREAVIHFTGSVPCICEIESAAPGTNGQRISIGPEFTPLIRTVALQGRIRIKAAGYYIAIGA
jgi:hypothetical protein